MNGRPFDKLRANGKSPIETISKEDGAPDTPILTFPRQRGKVLLIPIPAPIKGEGTFESDSSNGGSLPRQAKDRR